jgi:hypothetical protein
VRAGLALLASALPLAAGAHGFDERHELPAPLAHFVAGAALAVALSFVVAAIFARRAPVLAPGEDAARGRTIRVPGALRSALRVAALALFIVTLSAALWGTADPMMNLAPTLVWIVWWVGLSLVVACVGNVWPVLDPWATLFDAAQALAFRLGLHGGLSLQWPWPPWLGAWPAVGLLLAWSWLEVVYPLAVVPHRIGIAALGWSALTLLGMLCFGRDRWQRHGDVFAIYFALLGRMAPLAWHDGGKQILVCRPASALIASPDEREFPAGSVAFVIAMLSTVLFDGLHGGAGWSRFEGALARAGFTSRPDSLAAGTLGLLLAWLLLLAAYVAICWLTAKSLRGHSTAILTPTSIARAYALTFIPIAVGYNVAHNFSSLIEQGQNLLFLASDPFGWHWDLFGTAQLHTRSGLVDARMTWSVAIAMVVLGHCSAVWLAHRVAMRDQARPADAVRAALPLVLLMLAFTALSLFVIADPMVRYTPAAHPG